MAKAKKQKKAQAEFSTVQRLTFYSRGRHILKSTELSGEDLLYGHTSVEGGSRPFSALLDQLFREGFPLGTEVKITVKAMDPSRRRKLG